ncbi:hypothetical protein LMG27198_19040 [Methylocystis echinoides]|uniref:Uncharacterized protein n=1 Tax=Methylocystis echinoides TaxID=29468 RepID=A0A9W6GTR3_9HYPH|nr:hypothetical protein LMG27198_19040 [Methylocystis echinoides]
MLTFSKLAHDAAICAAGADDVAAHQNMNATIACPAFFIAAPPGLGRSNNLPSLKLKVTHPGVFGNVAQAGARAGAGRDRRPSSC